MLLMLSGNLESSSASMTVMSCFISHIRPSALLCFSTDLSSFRTSTRSFLRSFSVLPLVSQMRTPYPKLK